jgi:hypothetical protein
LTVTGKLEAAEREAVKVALAVPVLPSVTTTSSIEILGLSSLAIVAVAVLVVIVELSGAVPFGLLRVTVIVSSGSTAVSPKTSTAIVLVVSLAAKAIVPVAVVAPAALILL